VDFFFCLSGFVIAVAYEGRLLAGLTLPRFMSMRILRLYPLFLVGIGLGAVKAMGQIVVHDNTALTLPTLILSIFTSFLMLPTPGAGLVSIFPLNTPAWSLFFEMVANTLFAALIFKWSDRKVAIAAAACGLLLATGVLTHERGVGPLGTTWPDFLFGFPRVAFSFLLGILIRRHSVTRSRERSGYVYLPVIALLFLLFVSPPSGFQSAYDLMGLILAIPAIVWWGARYEVGNIARPIFAWLGDISYPIYILHFPLLMIFLFIAKRFELSPLVLGLLFIGGLSIVSTLAFHIYDKPIRAWIGERVKAWHSANSPSN
jgi:peptidoglycan/LPS O-acetylase OafA/YrhL